MRTPLRALSCLALFATLCLPLTAAHASDAAPAHRTPPLEDVVHTPNAGRGGVVVADEIMAAKIGAEILAMGGNAVDAAVATGFALAVTHPSAGNVGGGGFMLVYLRETGKTIAVDYRETAPAAATRDMYLDADGNVDNELILHSYRSAGVPGTVAGLLHVQERYGRLSRRAVMAPAIRLASEGWLLNYYQAARIEASREGLSRDPTARATFFKPDGGGYLPGERFRWPELATTLEMIAEQGRDGFYLGPVADRIAESMAANGGLITREDLAAYEVSVREPVIGEFRGHEIVSMPPPSSGGVHLIQMLNMLQTKPPSGGAAESSERLHFIAEIMRRVFADRAEWLGDPDFVDVPTRGLLSPEYARALVAGIDPERASSSRDIRAGNPIRYESPQTTHYSVIDGDGNMVANTYTLNRSFGSRIIVPGTGILLNNEMDDFAAAPGVPNYYGLVGGDRNAIVAGKRPLSSMTPTLVFKDGEPFMSLGALGGSRIITAVFNLIVNVIDRQMNIADAIDAPRIHHQWLPDRLSHEPGLAADTIAALEERGHEVARLDWFAGAAAALVTDGWVFGSADSRIPGGAACFVDSGC